MPNRTMQLRHLLSAVVALAMVSVVTTPASARSRIEAVKGKPYRIAKNHGPWMIMVASLKDVDEESRKDLDGGLSAQEAADELVFDLRKRGIPAYTYKTNDIINHINMTDRRTGEARRRAFKAQLGHVVVMAGNYDFSEAEQKKARQTLAYVKNLKPDVLVNSEYGGVFKSTPGRPGPLSGAFLTLNPLLDADEIQRRKRDPLIMKLNAPMKYSLLRNKGKYTLQIATFTGKSMIDNPQRSAVSKFDKKMGELYLHRVGDDAWRLCEAMRSAKAVGYDTNYETWVFHDRNKSIVTIGSFDSKDDPQIRRAYEFFRAKAKTDSKSRQLSLTPTLFTIPKNPKSGGPDAMWPLDPNPQLIEVPRVGR